MPADGYLAIDTTGRRAGGWCASRSSSTASKPHRSEARDAGDCRAHPERRAATIAGGHLRSVGFNGGEVAAFAFDLAKSVVYTRQGNPEWVGQDRDGLPPVRPNDLFFGAADQIRSPIS